MGNKWSETLETLDFATQRTRYIEPSLDGKGLTYAISLSPRLSISRRTLPEFEDENLKYDTQYIDGQKVYVDLLPEIEHIEAKVYHIRGLVQEALEQSANDIVDLIPTNEARVLLSTDSGRYWGQHPGKMLAKIVEARTEYTLREMRDISRNRFVNMFLLFENQNIEYIPKERTMMQRIRRFLQF